MRKKVDHLPLDFMESVAEEKNGKLEVRKRPTETKIFLIYPDCRDCIHWQKCGKKWQNLNIDTNELAQNCEEYRKKETSEEHTHDHHDWKTHQKDKEKPKIGNM